MNEKHSLIASLIELARRAVPGKISARGPVAAQLERAVADAQAGRAAALDEAARLMADRDAKILDLTDDEIFALDRAVEVSELRAARFEAVLPGLIDRLTEARSTARNAEIETAKGVYLRALEQFADSAAETNKFAREIVRFRENFGARGFRELLSMPSIPLLGSGAIVIDASILARLRDEIDRAAHGVRPRAEPEITAAKSVAATTPAPPAPVEIVGLRLPEPPAPRVAGHDDLPITEAGLVRLVILRPGVEIGGRRLTGTIEVTKADALKLLQSGAADLAA